MKKGRRTFRILLILIPLVLGISLYATQDSWKRMWYSQRLASNDPKISENAAEILLKLNSPQTIPQVIQAAHRHRFLSMHMYGLTETYDEKDFVPALEELIKIVETDDPFDCMAAIQGLKKIGEKSHPAVPSLIKAYKYWRDSPDFSIHHEILMLLPRIKPTATEAVPMLQEATKSYEAHAAYLANEALKVIAPEKAIKDFDP